MNSAPTTAPASTKPGTLVGAQQEYRILLIDDTVAIHEDFGKILRPEPTNTLDDVEKELFGISAPASHQAIFHLSSAYQGQEGLQLLKQALEENRPYSLAFVDVRMPPGWDGIETISHLWAQDPELQVVISTAYSDYSWSEVVQRFGTTDNLVILKKPFDNIEVLQLTHALTKKWELTRQARRQVQALDEIVKERTEQLRCSNDELRSEIAERRRAETRIEAFSHLGQRLSATNTARSAAEIIVDVADQVLGWDSCWLDLYSASEDSLSNVLLADIVDGKRVFCAPARQNRTPSGLARRAMQDGGQLLFKSDPTKMDPSALPFGDVKRASASVLAVPIRAKAEVIGVLSIQSYKQKAYDLESLSTLQALADHCSGALDRIHAQEKLEAMQAQLRQSQKLEAIGQLAGGVAHDFNNLLTVIRGNTELVMMDAKPLGPTAAECLQQVVGAAERAANLTRQLLAFSRKQVMQAQALDVGEVVHQTAKMLRRIIGEHIQLQCELGAGVPRVHADAGMLEQALMNLALNARDAMPRGGQLSIRVSAVELDTATAHEHEEGRPGHFVLLTVADTGTGIPEQDLPHIFEPFFTTKEVGKGTGLGLSTVYGIVKQHQGWIHVASAPGAGSTFSIYLPVSETCKTSASAATPPPAPRSGTEHILLVEDEDAVRSLTRRLLTNFGYTVLEAESGKAALDLLEGSSPRVDLLLTDIIMPGGVSGRELAERLRNKNPRLKVIFTSGYSGDILGNETEFVRQTDSRFVAKPCPPHQLLNTIRSYLDATN